MTPLPHIVIMYQGEPYIVRPDALEPVDRESKLHLDVLAANRAGDWRKGLLVGLEAAVALEWEEEDMEDF